MCTRIAFLATITKPLILFLTVLIVYGVKATEIQDTSTDSLKYYTFRTHYSFSKSLELETADVLAENGLYADAIDILTNLSQSAIRADDYKKRGLEKTRWRISAGIDHFHLEDIDTSGMTLEEVQQYRLLMQTPLSVWAKAKLELQYNGGNLESICPEWYISNNRSRLEVPIKMAFFNKSVRVESGGKAEKWFQADASGGHSSSMLQRYSSDMGGAYLNLEYQNSATRSWNWVIPGSIDWEHYREDRIGYESYVELRTAPYISYTYSSHYQNTLRFSGDLRYTSHYYSDSLDLLGGSVRIEHTLSGKGKSLYTGVDYNGENYLKSPALFWVDRMHVVTRAEREYFNKFTPRISLRLAHQREHTIGKRTLSGTKFTALPSLRYSLSKILFAEPEISFLKKWAEPEGGDYLWSKGVIWEPGLRCGIESDRTNVSSYGRYCYEGVHSQFKEYTVDNRGYRIGLDGSVSLWAFFSANVLFEYQYKMYEPFGFGSRLTENMTISFNIQTTF